MYNRQSLHIAMLLWGCIFGLIAALCMFMSKNFDKEKRYWLIILELSVSVLLLSDAFAWGYRGSAGMTGYIIVRISNFMVFAVSDIIVMLYTAYMCSWLFEEKKVHDVRVNAVYVIGIIGVAMVIISQFTGIYYYIDDNNYYHRNTLYFISIVIPLLCMALDISLLLSYRKNISKRLFISFIFYVAFPIGASVIQVFYYGISLINIAISISIVLMFMVAIMEQNAKLARKEKEAADMKISIMMSQISPHFIYNTLTSIQSMCDLDPVLAEETISQFADYLRGNLESLSQTDNVPFERELRHVECYLAIEKKRFGSRINVEYDIKDKEFLLPSLTLQPIVENAVKYGLCKKKGGGTVRISTRRDGTNIIINVEDNGIGFNVKETALNIQEDDKVHIGISNVRSRIHDMCNGTISVDSKPGEGTKVVIILPQ